MKKNIFVIVGESGSGKTTLAKGLTATHSNIELLITSTSRPKRNELESSDYNFLSKEEFEELVEAKQFIEYAVFRDWYYGLSKETIQNCKTNNMVVVLNPVGLKNLVNTLNTFEYDIIPIYVYANANIRLIRSLGRDTDIDEVMRRFDVDRTDFKDITSYVLKCGGYVIRNDKSIELAVEQLEQIIEMVMGDLHG